MLRVRSLVFINSKPGRGHAAVVAGQSKEVDNLSLHPASKWFSLKQNYSPEEESAAPEAYRGEMALECCKISAPKRQPELNSASASTRPVARKTGGHTKKPPTVKSYLSANLLLLFLSLCFSACSLRSPTYQPTAAVSITPTSASLLIGGTQQFTATVSGTTNTAVTWSATGGTISSTGLYTAPSTAGSYVVTATSVADSTKSASATVTVSATVAVSISPTSATLAAGGTLQFTATVTGTTNTSVNWSATGGTISTSGLYTAPSTTGTYTVTAISLADTSKSASAVVTTGTTATTCTPLFGSYGVGNWPPACYKPYSATAWINRPLPPNPTVDPNSASKVSAFNSHGPPEDHGVASLGVSYDDYDHPIYWSKARDPAYTIAGCGSGKLNGVTFHALTGMVPGGGTDGHVAVMDQSSGEEYDFWQATINDSTHTIGGTTCGRLSISGDGRVNLSVDGNGANAADTGLYSGQIRGVELNAGVINHAIAVVASCTNGTFVYPAQGTAAGGCSSDPADGQFFQLTYTDTQIDALSVPAWKKIVLHAMGQYGFYIDDTGGGSHSFWVHFESGKMYHAYGYEDPIVTYAQQHLGEDISLSGGVYYFNLANGVDWTHIQVINSCVLQGTC